jgi:hypothetical protein
MKLDVGQTGKLDCVWLDKLRFDLLLDLDKSQTRVISDRSISDLIHLNFD